MDSDDWREAARGLLQDLQGPYGGQALDQEQRLDPVLQGLAEEAPPKDEPILSQSVYWINAAPFIALHALRTTGEHRGDDETPGEIGGALARGRYFGAKPPIEFAGRPMTLKRLRKHISGRKFQDPRIHLAVADGTRYGAPWPKDLVGLDALDVTLDEMAARFVRPPFAYNLDQERTHLVGHALFHDYRKPFSRLGGLTGIVEAFGPREDAEFLRHNACLVTYRKPDYTIRLAGQDS